MNVFVTGGAGYIGSHAVRQLIDEGHRVVVLDNLTKGYKEALDPRAVFFKGNMADEENLEKLFAEHAIEAVIHFAAHIEVGESVVKPFKYYRNNFSYSLSMLNAMKSAGVKKIVFSSTAAVYGNPVGTPILETHPRAPINPYGRSKMMMELAIEDFAQAYGLGYTILRYFNVAGASPKGDIGEAHEPESHLIPRILKVPLGQEKQVKIFGTDYPTPDGTCIRDYVHVEDLVTAHLLALRSIEPGRGEIYNLGSEKGFSVREVIGACESVVGQKIAVVEESRREGDPAVLIAGSEKIRSKLGWKPKYGDLKTIVQHAWNWHSTHPHGYASVQRR